MFHFPAFPSWYYFIHITILSSSLKWFPNSEICGSLLIYSSPQLIAVSHVLLRLLMPRHSPYALVRLNFSCYCLRFANNFFYNEKASFVAFYSACAANCSFTTILTEKPFSDLSLNPVKIICSFLFLFGFQWTSFFIAFPLFLQALLSPFFIGCRHCLLG